MPSTTLGSLLASVYSRLDNNALLYPRADCVQEINDAIQVCNLLTGSIQTSIQLLTTDPTTNLPIVQLIYQVPPGIIFPVAVQYEGRELAPLSLRALAGQYRSWATDISFPQGRPVKEWAPIGWDKFVIHPIDGQGGRSIIVTGVAEPTPLVLDTDTIALPNDMANDIEDLVGSVLPIREGGQIFAAATAELYSSFIAKMRIKAAFTNLVWPSYYANLIGWKPYVPKSARIQRDE